MATKKMRMNQRNASNGYDVLYPETSTDMVIDEATGKTVAEHMANGVSHVPYGIVTGSANTYAVTLSPAPTALVEGMAVSVKINVNASAASTLNVNGLGAKGIKKSNGTDVTNLKANGIYTFRYDGTSFILQGEGGSGNAVASDLLSGKTASTDAGDIVGTMVNRGAVNITPGTTAQTIQAGYHNGSGSVAGDPDLIAANIKNGINIFGVVGNMPDMKKASGSLVTSSTVLNVTSLTFQPDLIIAYYLGGSRLSVWSSELYNYGGYYSKPNSFISDAACTPSANGFSISIYNPTAVSLEFYWIAIKR
ncbi:MAG: hypothetical protein ACQEW2_10770 [Bacillota bacterium]